VKSVRIFILFWCAILSVADVSHSAGWIKTFGDTGWEFGYKIVQTPDKGFLVSGETTSSGAGNVDFMIIRLRSDGLTEWTNTYGGPGHDEEPFGLASTTDGGFILAGKTDSFGAGSQDLWVIKLGADGSINWQKRYGGMWNDGAYEILETPSGYLVVGNSASFGDYGYDAWILSLDKNGEIVWQKRYGGSKADYAFAGCVARNHYYIAGATASSGAGAQDLWVMKLDLQGNIIWQKTFGGNDNDYALSILALSDGCLVGGETRSFGAGNGDAWVIRLSERGDILWQHTFGGPGHDVANAIDKHGNQFVIAGSTSSFGQGADDAWLFSLTDSGNLLWEKTYGGHFKDKAISLRATDDGNLVFAGGTSSLGKGGYDTLVIKSDSAGLVQGDLEVLTSSATMGTPILEQATPGFTGQNTNASPVTTFAMIPASTTGGQVSQTSLILNIVDVSCNTPATAGKITLSAPAQVECAGSSSCSYQFAINSPIALSATPSPGYVFSGWDTTNGRCEGSGCTFALTGQTVVTAKFKKIASAPPAEGKFIFFDPVQEPSCAYPIGVGLAYNGQPYVDLQVHTPVFERPVDLYFAFMAPDLVPDTIFLITSTGIEPLQNGLKPWKSSIVEAVNEKPLGEQHVPGHLEIPGIEVPPGTYHIFLLITPAGKQLSQGYLLYQTTFVVQ